MENQFKYSKQTLTNDYMYLSMLPEQVVMIQLQNSMESLKLRSFKSYLKSVGCKKIQRTSISIKEIASLLNISTREADYLAVQWMNTVGGNVTYCADVAAYYFNGTYEIVN